MTAEQLRTRARQYREMARTASSIEIADGLIRLAERFEALAELQEDDGEKEV